MSFLTGLLYGCLIIYLGGWYAGKWTGNFSLLLFILTIVTLAFWLAERFHFKPAREKAAAGLQEQDTQRRAALAAKGITQVDGNVEEARDALLAQPWWLDWTAGLFPVILVVFLLRSFLFEPFKIPSGSMIPTLQVGDLILVSKFHYGIRLPVINKKILDNHDPARGDVMVFRYPRDPSIDYIKRVVGIPGDEIRYIDKILYVNGQRISKEPLPPYYNAEPMRRMYAQQFKEDLTGVPHNILNYERARPDQPEMRVDFPFHEACNYTVEGYVCKVPKGHYFMMGDNRDDSEDSRSWGFVPDENIVGKAFFVWMNLGDLSRIGSFR